MLRRTGISRAPGPRVRERLAYNAELNKLGITWCEINLCGCLRGLHLSWAHSRKSRDITEPAHWMEAARACQHCHSIIEAMSHDDMGRIVREAIARRGSEPAVFTDDY